MTSPTQRRHDEILGRLDALIDAVRSTTARDNLHRLLAEESAAERRGEPVDVTECRDCGRSDGGCDRVDTAPDVDPDEALARALYEAFWRTEYPYDEPSETWLRVARVARERIEAEHKADLWGVLKAEQMRADELEAKIERLTRERDEAQERHELLRAGVNGLRHIYRHIRNPIGKDVSADLTHTLNLDDERGK